MPPVKNVASAASAKELSDLLDRTMELDIRGFLDDCGKADPPAVHDEPTVVLDLTATQVHDLLAKK